MPERKKKQPPGLPTLPEAVQDKPSGDLTEREIMEAQSGSRAVADDKTAAEAAHIRAQTAKLERGPMQYTSRKGRITARPIRPAGGDRNPIGIGASYEKADLQGGKLPVRKTADQVAARQKEIFGDKDARMAARQADLDKVASQQAASKQMTIESAKAQLPAGATVVEGVNQLREPTRIVSGPNGFAQVTTPTATSRVVQAATSEVVQANTEGQGVSSVTPQAPPLFNALEIRPNVTTAGQSAAASVTPPTNAATPTPTPSPAIRAATYAKNTLFPGPTRPMAAPSGGTRLPGPIFNQRATIRPNTFAEKAEVNIAKDNRWLRELRGKYPEQEPIRLASNPSQPVARPLPSTIL